MIANIATAIEIAIDRAYQIEDLVVGFDAQETVDDIDEVEAMIRRGDRDGAFDLLAASAEATIIPRRRAVYDGLSDAIAAAMGR